MNEEVEIKAHLKNPGVVEAFLNKEAELIKNKKQVDVYYTPNKKDFFAIHPVTKYLRIRTEGKRTTLEYLFCHFEKEGSLLKTDEYEVSIDNPKNMDIILRQLGFVEKVTVVKQRASFAFNSFEISLDFIEDLGHFIEVEAKNITK